MTESFAKLFEESLTKIQARPGSMIHGIVVLISKDIVLVDAGLKSESAIPIEQFHNSQGKLEIMVGDHVDVILDTIEDGYGETILSREKAKRYESWLMLEKSYSESTTVIGTITGKVKGGFTVDIDGIRAFLPGSLVDTHPIRDMIHLESKPLEFKIIKLDKKRNNIVLSRRAIIEYEHNIERDQLLMDLKEGVNIKGVVKNLTDYGAFIDLGGIDGLLHITDIAWKRIKHPSEIISLGDEILVKVLKFDRERIRVSLGLKQLIEDPWVTITNLYPEGTRLTGKVTNITDYGCFVEIEKGIEGLVHISEMDWTNKNIHPSKVVNIGDIINVIVLDIDKERRRISLGLKQCTVNPWYKFSETYKKGDHIQGKIKSITDFGIFIGLEGGIDGLVHLSDISWNIAGEEAVRKYKKGDEITAIVLQVDADRERISLGIKQLLEDPFNNYITINKKGTIVNGTVTSIDDQKNIMIKLSDNIVGHIRCTEYTNYKTNNSIQLLNIGDNIETKIINVDRKNRIIYLSLPSQKEEKETVNNILEQNKREDMMFSNAMTEAFKAATKNE